MWLHKYIGFVIAGAVGGFAGVLWAYYNGFVSPNDVQLVTSVETLLMVALGGSGTLIGPAVGAAGLLLAKYLISSYVQFWMLVVGTLTVGASLVAARRSGGANAA